jgi:hypothetical protein
MGFATTIGGGKSIPHREAIISVMFHYNISSMLLYSIAIGTISHH